MFSPWEQVTVYPQSFPLIDTIAVLGIGGTISSPQVDILDLLAVRQGSPAGGGGTEFEYEPQFGTPLYFLDYYVFVKATTQEWCPGMLQLFTRVLDPATAGLSATTELQNTIHFNGPAVDYNQVLATTVSEQERGIAGTVRLSSRTILATYTNNNFIAQTTFKLSVSIRAW